MGYQQSNLWQLTLAARKDDIFEESRERLRVVYDNFWLRGTALAQRISSDLPDLTLHDSAHLEALWDRAGQLTGENYEINPLEAFVLGGAILLHDVGHALAAYPGGIREVRGSVEYQDSLALELRKYNQTTGEAVKASDQESIESHALLAALRRLHARQAERLAEQRFQDQFLIDDSDIRSVLGQLIGQIAASHHWDRAILDTRLPLLQGAPGFLPQQWRIQPLKLACLLRCADAIQIDQRRTSAFSLAIQNPSQDSKLHWIAQQIAQPTLEDIDRLPGSLAFTSQVDFTEENADAWWVAYDLIRAADTELGGCYQLIKSKKLPLFTVDRVSGATNPTRLSNYIRTRNWKPVHADIKVTSAEQIIKLFGGEALYGRDPAVPLRELIQNAADAVRARRHLAKDPYYEGKVVVGIEPGGADGYSKIVVMDDGIGMGEQVLTGPLLEFGKSFWASTEAQDLFPGLVSSPLRQGGKFGIGFFSVLIIANEIMVTSRRFDRSEEAYTLHLRRGLKLRPILLQSDGQILGQFSTRVEIKILKSDLNELLSTKLRNSSNQAQDLSIGELVAHLAPCLDCDVYTAAGVEVPTLSHCRKWYEQDALTWLKEILLAKQINNKVFNQYLEDAAPMTRILYDNRGDPCGRAAIGFGYVAAGIDSINGLTAGSHIRNIDAFSRMFVGAMCSLADGPSRFTGKKLYVEARINDWATNQASFFADDNNGLIKYLVSVNVADFFGNPEACAMMILNREVKSLAEIYELLTKEKELFAVVEEPLSGHIRLTTLRYQASAHSYFGLKDEEVDFIKPTLEIWDRWHSPTSIYQRAKDINGLNQNSFLGCLNRYTETKGKKLGLQHLDDILLARFIGSSSARENLVQNQELYSKVIRIHLKG